VSVLPFSVNLLAPLAPLPHLAEPEARVYVRARAPRVYAAVRQLPDRAVLVELPLEPNYDRRAMYYSTMHRRRLLNGYSGFHPPEYETLVGILSDILRQPDAALEALRQRQATHALVHEAAYLGGEGGRISALFRASGAVEIFHDGRDALFALPSGSSSANSPLLPIAPGSFGRWPLVRVTPVSSPDRRANCPPGC
jgi:hypothetical protein